MDEKNDIFERIMSLRLLAPLRPLWRKYREPLLYLFFGGLTFFLSFGLYWLFAHPLGVTPLIANVISWILCVVFAYLTNRTWVFADKAREPGSILREALSFAAGRLATLGLEELILWLGIDVLGIHDLLVKIVAQVLVIVGNYVISKWFVFRKA